MYALKNEWIELLSLAQEQNYSVQTLLPFLESITDECLKQHILLSLSPRGSNVNPPQYNFLGPGVALEPTTLTALTQGGDTATAATAAANTNDLFKWILKAEATVHPCSTLLNLALQHKRPLLAIIATSVLVI